MARKRMIDPSIWTSEDFGTLTDLAQIYWIGIISNADDDGRIKISPAFLKANIRPYSTDSLEDVGRVIEELSSKDMLRTYQANGETFGHLPKWFDYQKISHPTKSKIPNPPDPSDNPPEDSGGFGKATPQFSLNEVKENLKEVQEKEKVSGGSLSSEGVGVAVEEEDQQPDPAPLSDRGRLTSVLDETECNRWLRKYLEYRPGLCEPFTNLNNDDIIEARGRVDLFIAEVGEQKSIALLADVFAGKREGGRRPVSVKQAVMYCQDVLDVEKKKHPHAPAPQAPLTDDAQALEIAYERIRQRVTDDLGIGTSPMGKAGDRKYLSVYGARENGLADKVLQICEEEGMHLELEVL